MNTVEIKKIWDEIKEQLEKEIPSSTFGPWISTLEAVSFEDDTFTLISGVAMGVEYVKRTQYKTILECFKNYFGRDIVVNLEFNQEAAEAIKKERQKTEKKIQKEQEKEEEHKKAIENLSYVKSLNINLRYRFDNFVEDSNNKIAKAAAQAVAKNPTGKYNPLYIQGASGLGKTHLMQAIGHYVTMNSNLKVRCVKTDDFVTDYCNSTRFTPNQNTTVSMNKFRNKYRNVDILLIDDIQFIENKKKCIDELFHTFDALYNANKQIVLTSDKLPKDLPEIPERLRNRFEQGLIVEIYPPEYETRVKILENFAKEKGIENIPKEVFEYIAKYKTDNVRELEGGFTTLDGYSNFEETPITLEYAKKVLKYEENNKKPDIEKVIEEVAKFYDISVEDIKSSSRVQKISNARAIVSYIAREKLGKTYKNIALSLNKRHQTITYSAENIKKSIKNDNNLKNETDKILKALNL